jgi:hypothetical protein
VGGAAVNADDLRTAFDALNVAAESKRDAADACGDCDGYPSGALCGSCEHRLQLADEYDALAERLKEQL